MTGFRTDFTSSVWNCCRWVEDVPPRETFPAAKSEEERLFSQAKCLCGETMASYHRKGDRSRRGTLLSERKFMKRWRSGRLNPCTPNNVSTYKRDLKWLTGNRYRVVTWPKYLLSQFIPGINGPSVWIIGVIRCPCTKCIKSCGSLFK